MSKKYAHTYVHLCIHTMHTHMHNAYIHTYIHTYIHADAFAASSGCFRRLTSTIWRATLWARKLSSFTSSSPPPRTRGLCMSRGAFACMSMFVCKHVCWCECIICIAVSVSYVHVCVSFRMYVCNSLNEFGYLETRD
jgi:hypothetical protein